MPISDLDLFRGLVDRVLRPVGQEAAVSAGMELIEYINEAMELRRADPGDDLLSALIHLEDEGDRLDHFELLSMVQLLLIAGHETTVNLIGNGMIELMSHPDQQKMLVSCPDLMDTAIEEMVRFNSPVETPFPRFAYENVKFGDVTIPVGDTVVPVLLAANRYPDHFDEPDTSDITRDPNKYLAFGFGVHYCLGAPLAGWRRRAPSGSCLSELQRSGWPLIATTWNGTPNSSCAACAASPSPGDLADQNGRPWDTDRLEGWPSGRRRWS